MNDDRDLGTRGDENATKGGLGKLGGKVQEGVGKLTGNDDLENKGKINQAKGGLQQGLGDAERKVDHALDDKTDNPNAL